MQCEFLVVGGGIAGASVAYFLAGKGRVVVLERESAPGYHSTGRSAALYTENYGNRVIRLLTAASRAFFDAPPDGLGDAPWLIPRGVLFVAPPEGRAVMDALLAEARATTDAVHEIPAAEALARVPVLRPETTGFAAYEAEAMDMDVHGIHTGFLRGLRARGGQVVTDAEVRGVRREDGLWVVDTPAGRFRAAVLVNAAGAWADELAALAGVAPVGLVPKRRTAITFDPPADMAVAHWPMVVAADESFYFKPEAGRVLASPADETPMPPSDVQPDELDIAITVDKVETCTTLPVRRITHSWAGLRSFVADRTPVVGFDPSAAGFFWLAGQGGYGIQTSAAIGRVAAALAAGEGIPADLAARGLTEADLSPARLRGTVG